MSATPSPSKGSLVLWLLAGVPFLAVGLFVAVWLFLSPSDGVRAVAFTDLVEEVHAGHVREIHARGRTLRFVVRAQSGKQVTEETIGPSDEALILSLRPTDPKLPAPKVAFEK